MCLCPIRERLIHLQITRPEVRCAVLPSMCRCDNESAARDGGGCGENLILPVQFVIKIGQVFFTVRILKHSCAPPPLFQEALLKFTGDFQVFSSF